LGSAIDTFVEIAGRHGRIGGALSCEEARDVAQIFPLQRLRLIFRVSLKEKSSNSVIEA
jgi:hypothetical protein